MNDFKKYHFFATSTIYNHFNKKKGFLMLELSFELMFAFFMLFVLFGISFLPAQFFFTPYED